MKRITLVIFLFLSAFASWAQKKNIQQKAENPYAATDKLALDLPDTLTNTTERIAGYITANFKTDSDKARAVFIWVASNIQYDVEHMFAINFQEKEGEKITKALKTKTGICENYAAVFTDLCLKCGLKSYVVTGYTKQNGFADYIAHAWCAAQINDSWFLFDPTWGSGYEDNGKFVKKIDNAYYKVAPARLIRSHMPFDPMWEFLNYPVTNQEFYEGKVQENRSKSYFSYTDSIAAYDKLSEPDQYADAARRIEVNGIKNALIFNELQNLKISAYNTKVHLYNGIVTDYNDGINEFNNFIKYRNNQFKPMKPDAQIQAMFDRAYNKITGANNKLKQIADPNTDLSAMIASLQRSIDDVMTHVEEQKAWLAKYFTKGKFGRSGMFTKITWMGIPLN